eukprot:917066-Pelagomonas_calceolata.AAC.6
MDTFIQSCPPSVSHALLQSVMAPFIQSWLPSFSHGHIHQQSKHNPNVRIFLRALRAPIFKSVQTDVGLGTHRQDCVCLMETLAGVGGVIKTGGLRKVKLCEATHIDELATIVTTAQPRLWHTSLCCT